MSSASQGQLSGLIITIYLTSLTECDAQRRPGDLARLRAGSDAVFRLLSLCPPRTMHGDRSKSKRPRLVQCVYTGYRPTRMRATLHDKQESPVRTYRVALILQRNPNMQHEVLEEQVGFAFSFPPECVRGMRCLQLVTCTVQRAGGSVRGPVPSTSAGRAKGIFAVPSSHPTDDAT